MKIDKDIMEQYWMEWEWEMRLPWACHIWGKPKQTILNETYLWPKPIYNSGNVSNAVLQLSVDSFC